jgi:hypothetical protein
MYLVGHILLRHKKGKLIRKRTFLPPESLSFGHIHFKVLVIQIIAADLSVPFHVFCLYLLTRASSIFLGILIYSMQFIGFVWVFKGIITNGFV